MAAEEPRPAKPFACNCEGTVLSSYESGMFLMLE